METVFSYIITFSLCLPSFAFFGGILAFFSMVLAQFSEVLGLLAMISYTHHTKSPLISELHDIKHDFGHDMAL